MNCCTDNTVYSVQCLFNNPILRYVCPNPCLFSNPATYYTTKQVLPDPAPAEQTNE